MLRRKFQHQPLISQIHFENTNCQTIDSEKHFNKEVLHFRGQRPKPVDQLGFDLTDS